MQQHHSSTNDIGSIPNDQAAGVKVAQRHRARHRHVGDVRFALFMVSILVLACGFAFRG